MNETDSEETNDEEEKLDKMLAGGGIEVYQDEGSRIVKSKEEGADIAERMKKGAQSLQTVLEEDPKLDSKIIDLANSSLKEAPTANSAKKFLGSLCSLLAAEGGDAFELIANALSSNSSGFIVQMQEAVGDDYKEAQRFIKELIAKYGDEAERAFSGIGELQDDWRRGEINLNFIPENEKWSLEMNLEKFDSSSVYCKMSIDSTLSLISIMLNALNKNLPEDFFEDEELESFQENSVAFLEKFLRK